MRADVERLLAHLADTQPPTTWPTSAGSIPVRSIERLLGDAEQLGGVHGGQAAATAPDGRPDGIDDHDVGHGVTLGRILTARSRSAPAPAALAGDHAVDEQQQGGADEGDEHRADPEVADALVAGGIEQCAPDQAPDHTDGHRGQAALTADAGHPARECAGDETDDDPADDAHGRRG